MFLCVGFAVGQVYIPTGVSTQSGIVRNVPTSLVRLSADTLFTDGNRAFVAAEVPFHWLGGQRGLDGNQNRNGYSNNNNKNNNDDDDQNRRNSAGDNDGRRNDNRQDDVQRPTQNGANVESDLIRFANENRRSGESQSQNHNNNDQRLDAQQYKSFNQNGNDQSRSSAFNSEQLRTFDRAYNHRRADRYRANSADDAGRTDDRVYFDTKEQTNRRYWSIVITIEPLASPPRMTLILDKASATRTQWYFFSFEKCAHSHNTIYSLRMKSNNWSVNRRKDIPNCYHINCIWANNEFHSNRWNDR